MKIKNLLTALVVLVISQGVTGQNGKLLSKQSWVSESGSQDMLIRTHSTLDIYGNSFTVGATLNGSGNYDLYVTKTNGSGVEVWNYQEDGAANVDDFGTFVAVDSFGNVYFSGAIGRSSADSLDIFLKKLDSTGSLVWTHAKNGAVSGLDAGSHIFFDNSSNVYVVGSILQNATKKQDVYLAKLTSGGSLSWETIKDFNNSYDFGLRGRYDSPTGNCFVFGLSKTDTVFNNWDVNETMFSSSTGFYINSSTVTNWQQGYVVSIEDAFFDENGNTYLTGMSIDTNGQRDIFVNKIDDTFTESWQLTFDAGNNWSEYGKDLFVDDSGYVYVAGDELGGDLINRMLVAKISSLGALVWVNTFSGENAYGSSASVVVVDEYGFTHVCGTMGNGSDLDMVSVSYNWAGHYNGMLIFDGENGDDILIDAFAKEGDLYFFGQSETGSGFEVVTVNNETFHIPLEINGTDWGDHLYVKNQIILEFTPAALNSSLVNYDNGESFGDLSDYLNSTAIAAIKAKITDDDISISSWKAERILPHWTSGDTLTVTRDGDTVRIPTMFSSLVLHIPSTYVDSVAVDSLDGLDTYIDHVSLNAVAKFSGTPNDYFFYEQAYLKSGMTYHHISIEGAWDRYDPNPANKRISMVGLPSVKIGVFDTGINWGHEDMTRSFAQRKDGSKSRIQGGNCYSCGTVGSVFNADPDHNDIQSATHGTYVAGIIGAIRNNDLGVAGIVGGNGANSTTGPSLTTGCSMFDMKVGSFNGQGEVIILGSHLLAAYQDGAASTTGGNGLGLNILNNSWGLPTGADPLEFEKFMRAIQFAYKMKCTILFASGNDNGDAMTETLIPGLLPDGWCILIGATDVSGVRVWYGGWGSNYSSRLDHACAGTEDNLYNLRRNTISYPQSLPGDGTKYAGHNGTSFSVPQATGVAGMVMGYIEENGGPILAIEDVEKIMQLGSEYFTSPTGVQTGYETGRGHGRINATKTVELIEASQFRLYHINSDNSAFTSTYSVGSSPVSSYKAINLVDGMVPGVTGDARADIYHVTCSTSFTTPIALYNSIYYWPRHSYADGYQNYVSDIRTVSGVPDLYYQSETYNSVSLSFVDGATSGTAQFSSYFYKVTEVKGVTLSTPVWYPFDPNVTNPKFGFTIFGSTWPTSVEDVEEFDNKLYPNPTNQLINIEVDPEFSSTSVDVSIYTSTGALVKRETFKSDGATITMDVNNYIPGIYFVHLEADGRKQYFKVVKTK